MFELWTDGGAVRQGNAYRGGWGVVVIKMGQKVGDYNGFAPDTTNNRMELCAIINGLLCIPNKYDGSHVTVYSDSKYCIEGISSWIHNWIRKGWMRSESKKVKNKDLWLKLLDLTEYFDIEWQWVKGHADIEYNERADQLATEAIRSGKSTHSFKYEYKDPALVSLTD